MLENHNQCAVLGHHLAPSTFPDVPMTHHGMTNLSLMSNAVTSPPQGSQGKVTVLREVPPFLPTQRTELALWSCGV